MSPFKNQDMSANFSKPPLPREERKHLADDLDMPPEEYEQYKRDILKDLEKEKRNNNYQEMNDMILNGIGNNSKIPGLDFSRDLEREVPCKNNTSREENEAIDISHVSDVNKNMEDVKELKRLLYLAKMKFRKEYSDPNGNKQKNLKIRKKIKNPKRSKGGYLKKSSRGNMPKSRKKRVFPGDNLFSYEYPSDRAKVSTGQSKRNKRSRDQLGMKRSIFPENNYPSLENDKRRTFFGDMGSNVKINPLNREGYKTDNFNPNVNLVKSSSTKFYSDYQHAPNYNIDHTFPKRVKTRQQTRHNDSDKNRKLVWWNPPAKTSTNTFLPIDSNKATMSIEGNKKIINPKSLQSIKGRRKRLGTAQVGQRSNNPIYLKGMNIEKNKHHFFSEFQKVSASVVRKPSVTDSRMDKINFLQKVRQPYQNRVF